MICRKQVFDRMSGVTAAAAAIWLTAIADVQAATKITSIDFRGTVSPNVIEIRGDGPIQFEKQESAADKQVVIELREARLSPTAGRKIDTSSFDSPVVLISPYQVKGQPDTVRVVIQLRQNVEVQASSQGNAVKVSIPAGATGGGGAEKPRSSLDEGETPVETSASAPEAPPSEVESLSETSVAVVDKGTKAVPSERSEDGGADRLKEFMANRGAKRFRGKPITLQVRDMDAVDVFRLIGDASGFNIILSDDVKGKVTLSLIDVPWDQALDVVLQTLGLGAERNNNILRVTTLANLAQEKTNELKAQQAAKATTPRITRIFPISYANLDDLQKTLSTIQTQMSEQETGMVSRGPGATEKSGGTIVADKRTNSLIVRDLPENIERLQKLIEILDTQTPQVMIEGKVIEATEAFASRLGGQLGFSGTSANNAFFASFSGANPIDPLFGSPGIFTGSSIATATANTGSVAMSFVPGSGRLTALLNWGESESKLKVIASPKTVVLNKETAQIVQSTPVAITTQTISNGVATQSTTILQANLSLDVKPTVTNDGSVLMNLTLTRDVPFNASGSAEANSVANRKITTQVIVESGTTLVLGGFYTMTNRNVMTGFPYLRKIPLLGFLFGTEADQSERSELFFFITPQIMNPKKAGVGT